jgi:hypothetical protein
VRKYKVRQLLIARLSRRPNMVVHRGYVFFLFSIFFASKSKRSEISIFLFDYDESKKSVIVCRTLISDVTSSLDTFLYKKLFHRRSYAKSGASLSKVEFYVC